MAQYSATFTLVTPWGTITLNGGTSPYYYVDPDNCSGLDMEPVRIVVDDKPQAAGGIVHPGLYGPRYVVLSGLLIFGTDSERTVLEDNLTNALKSIVAANGSLQWTPTGGTSRTLTVRCDIGASYPGASNKKFVFGLVCANPTWV